MTSQRHAKRGFRLRRCGCASWSRSTPPPNPRRAPRRKRRRSSHANRRKDRTEEDKKSLTKLAPEFPLDLRTKTQGPATAILFFAQAPVGCACVHTILAVPRANMHAPHPLCVDALVPV